MIVTNAYKHAKSVPKCKDTLFTAFCAIFVASYFLSTAGHTVSAPAATGYSGPFRTLNGELLSLSHLRCLTFVRQAAFLTRSSVDSPLNATALMVPQLNVRLLQMEAESNCSNCSCSKSGRAAPFVDVERGAARIGYAVGGALGSQNCGPQICVPNIFRYICIQ